MKITDWPESEMSSDELRAVQYVAHSMLIPSHEEHVVSWSPDHATAPTAGLPYRPVTEVRPTVGSVARSGDRATTGWDRATTGWDRARTVQRVVRAAFLLTCICIPACNSFKITSPFIPSGPKIAIEPPPPLPSKRHFRVADFVFTSDFELRYDQSPFSELGFLGEQIRRELFLPPSERPVMVYLFEDRNSYERYTQSRYPEVPRRRAFFVAQPNATGGEELIAYTFWGEHIRQDLRHELTHAVLHGVLKEVPLWLDEGLAEYFEVEPGGEGVNPLHLDAIRQIGPSNFQPNLARLEQLNQLQQMSPDEYREAWAWVHFMLRSEPETKQVLTTYLRELRKNPNPGPLQPRLAAILPNAPASLRRHLSNVDRQQSTARPLPGKF